MLADAAMITVVEDREGDIYDQFARRPPSVHLLVRAAQDRALAVKQPLFAHCAGWPEQARYPVAVPPQGGRPGRTATVALRFGEVVLKRPPAADTALPATLTLRVVDVAEIDPTNAKERVHWCLLTTHTVQTQEDARRIVAWYQMRWIIEQVFRTLKSAGVEVESSQITRPANLLKLTVVALIAAVRVMQLVLARDGSTGQSLSDAAEPADVPALQAINATLEGRTDKLKNPFDVTNLAWLAWIAARLGGWSGYTSRGYRPAGPKTIARGLKLLDPMVAGWRLANRSALLGLP
jgi:Transposase DDE domain